MLEPGQPIGNYRIVQKLGEGGMGAVFEAVHQDIGRHVAIKVLHAQYSKDQQVAIRFLNEARAAAIVDHPGIVDIFEYGRLPDGTTFLVMEFLKGRSLRALLKQEGKLGVGHALRITRQIASALAAAHEKGIIHRGRFAEKSPSENAAPRPLWKSTGSRGAPPGFVVSYSAKAEPGEVRESPALAGRRGPRPDSQRP